MSFNVFHHDVRTMLSEKREALAMVTVELKNLKTKKAKLEEGLEALERDFNKKTIPLFAHCHHDAVEVKIEKGRAVPEYMSLIGDTRGIPDGYYYFTPETTEQKILLSYHTGQVDRMIVQRRINGACDFCEEEDVGTGYISPAFDIYVNSDEEKSYRDPGWIWCQNCEDNYLIRWQLDTYLGDALQSIISHLRKIRLVPLLLFARHRAPESLLYEDRLPRDMFNIIWNMTFVWGP